MLFDLFNRDTTVESEQVGRHISRNKKWSKEELILALDLYFKVGTTSATNPDVIELSECLNRLSDPSLEPNSNKFRNPNGVAMKVSNFASLDPNYSGKGLSHRGRLEQQVWDEFNQNRGALASEATAIKSALYQTPVRETNTSIQRQVDSVSSKEDLKDWVVAALRFHGGKATVLQVCTYIWTHYEDELRSSGPLFYTWQYDVRWAAYVLRRAGIMREVGAGRSKPWELA